MVKEGTVIKLTSSCQINRAAYGSSSFQGGLQFTTHVVVTDLCGGKKKTKHQFTHQPSNVYRPKSHRDEVMKALPDYLHF